MSFENLAINQQQTAENLVDTQDARPLLKRGFEKIKLIEGPTRTATRNTSTDTIWGRENWGASNWDGTYANDEVVHNVVNYNNKFIEMFTTELYNNTAYTTATWDTSGTLTIATTEVVQSLAIFKNDETIKKATLNVTGTNTDLAKYYLSTNGSSSWEAVTLGEKHTFSTTQQHLRLSITNTSGSTVSLTKLTVDYEV